MTLLQAYYVSDSVLDATDTISLKNLGNRSYYKFCLVAEATGSEKVENDLYS